MKKNWTLRIGVLVLVLTLVSFCLVGGTISKYTSTVTGTDSATVAKWAFAINDEDLVLDPAGVTPLTFTFDLFDTINDSDGTNDETDVADTLIAPGTTGSFEIKITNKSEVTADYVLTLSGVNANIPVEFSLDNTSGWTTAGEDDGCVVFTQENLREGRLAMSNTTDNTDEVTITVYWRWVFENNDGVLADNDAADTLLGITPPTLTVTANIVLTQVD